LKGRKRAETEPFYGPTVERRACTARRHCHGKTASFFNKQFLPYPTTGGTVPMMRRSPAVAGR
jgi:hypothetical protein